MSKIDEMKYRQLQEEFIKEFKNKEKRRRIREKINNIHRKISNEGKKINNSIRKRFLIELSQGKLPKGFEIVKKSITRDGYGVLLCKYKKYYLVMYKWPARNKKGYYYEVSSFPACYTLWYARRKFEGAIDIFIEVY